VKHERVGDKIDFDEPNNYVVSKTEFGPAILVFTDRDLALPEAGRHIRS
jgi:hypothetical protein